MDEDLMQVLASKLTTFASSEALPIQWPNKDIDNATLGEYLRLAINPVTPASFTVKGASRWQWECQVSIYVRDNTNAQRSKELSDLLKPIFPKGAKLIGATHVFDVTQPANPVPPIPLDGWYSTPVTFRVQTIH